MAARKTRKSASKKTGSPVAGVLRAFGALWRLFAKAIGSAIRFVFRGAQDLDPVHQRDGIAFQPPGFGLI